MCPWPLWRTRNCAKQKNECVREVPNTSSALVLYGLGRAFRYILSADYNAVTPAQLYAANTRSRSSYGW